MSDFYNASSCLINGKANANECEVFEHIYKQYKGAFTYSAINITDDGSIEIDCFMPRLSEIEVSDFLNKPLRVYKKVLPNGVVVFSLRGAISQDSIIDPTIYPDNRVAKLVEANSCTAYLVDTDSNRILGIRMYSLGNEIYNAISEALNDMSEKRCTSLDAFMAYQKYVIPISPSNFVKTATYIGREKGSVRTQELTMFR